MIFVNYFWFICFSDHKNFGTNSVIYIILNSSRPIRIQHIELARLIEMIYEKN